METSALKERSSVAVDLERQDGLIVVREARGRPWVCLGAMSLAMMAVALAGVVLMYLSWRPAAAAGQQEKWVAEKITQTAADGDHSAQTLKQLKEIGVRPENPAAHLIAMLSENRAELSWLSNVDQAFLHSDMALVANNTELLVPKDGLYFLYTQATFQSPASSSTSLAQRGRPCRGEDGNPLFLSLKVEQYSLSLPDRLLPILSASRSLCLPMGHDGGDSRFKFWTVPLYQGALVRLSQGDRLRVKMDPMKLLDDHTSYFGAFAVSVTK